MSFGAGQIVEEADMQGRFPSVYTKPSSTARNTTTTLANDPDLAGIPLTEGIWIARLILFYTVANTTPKLKTRWAFTGTWDTFIRLCHGPGSTNTAAPDAATPSTFRGYSADTQDAVYNSSTSSAYSAVVEEASYIRVTAEGDLSLQWAQQTSNGSNVTVQPGSTFSVQKVADL